MDEKLCKDLHGKTALQVIQLLKMVHKELVPVFCFPEFDILVIPKAKREEYQSYYEKASYKETIKEEEEDGDEYINCWVHPSRYNIAIREDGELFRVPKHMGYGPDLPRNRFALIKKNRVTRYFDAKGLLLPKYWALPRIKEENNANNFNTENI